MNLFITTNLSWTISHSISNLFFKEFIFRCPMINLAALFNLTQSRTLRSLLDSLLWADWLLLRSLPLIFALSNSVILFTSVWYATSIARMRICCDSTLFCFRKLKLRRLIFLINCWSNLTINIVNQAKKNEKRMINHAHTYQGRRYFLFQAFTRLVLCCWRSWNWRIWLKPKELERKYLKIWLWETYRFLWNMSRSCHSFNW